MNFSTDKEICRFTIKAKILLGRKLYALNKNKERNWHYRVYSALKKKFYQLNEPILKTLPKISSPIEILYIYHHDSKRQIDLDNATSVIKKFLQDSLVDADVIAGDSYKYIVSNKEIWGGVADEAYCDVIIFKT